MDTKVLSAMWLWKHQDEIVKECKLGIITKTACNKRLAAFYSRRKWLGHYNPVGCIDCDRAKGIVLNEEDKGRITQEEQRTIIALMEKIGWTRLNLLSRLNILRFGREGEKKQIQFEKSDGLLRARFGNREINVSLDQTETEHRLKKLIEGD